MSAKSLKRTVGVVGAGRVGAVLGAALARAGHRVVAASGVSTASKARIERLLPAAEILPPDQVAARADLVLLAVPDDSLAGLVKGLAETGAFAPASVQPGQRPPRQHPARQHPARQHPARQRPGGHAPKIVVHTSGAHGLAVLAPATAAGAQPLALHPAMTFTGTAADLDRLAHGVSFGVTAPPELRAIAERLVHQLHGTAEWIAEDRRPMYHTALAHGANHLVTLVNEALDRLRDAGVVHPERVLAPLLGAALDNTLRLGDAALTGPVSRGDAGTVAKHLATLAESAPESLPAYQALARRTADRAIAAGRLRLVDAGELLGVLASAPRERVR